MSHQHERRTGVGCAVEAARVGHAPVVAEFVHEDAGQVVVAVLVHTHPTVDVGVGGPAAGVSGSVALLNGVKDLVVGSRQGYSQFGVDRRGDGRCGMRIY